MIALIILSIVIFWTVSEMIWKGRFYNKPDNSELRAFLLLMIYIFELLIYIGVVQLGLGPILKSLAIALIASFVITITIGDIECHIYLNSPNWKKLFA